ncbi:hypothetical protein JC221_273 [Yersinia phage JC221]|nr:hypothetical protein JC221_273 [Yersinia phage JC221]
MKLEIDLNKLYNEADEEIDLLPYFVKLKMNEMGIPVKIDPLNIRDPDIVLENGTAEYQINVDSMIMEITYNAR